MFAKNKRIDEIANRNEAVAKAAQQFRKDLASGKASLGDLPQLKQQYPSFGIFPCKAAGIEFVMFHAHDDLVVWDYIWLGEDGYETELVQTWVDWCRTPGVVLDIGAYSGLMSLLAARAHPDNEVHLFEPLERVIERANVNVKINGLGRKIARHPLAASDSTGEVKIHLYRNEDFLGTGSSIDAKSGKNVMGEKAIRTVAVDEYLPDIAPRTIKIDVEGHELATLKGLEQTIERAHPNLLIEVWERTRDEVLGRLRDHGYTLERVEPEERPVNNYIALPRG